MRRAVANLRGSGATFLTVHGDRAILEAAAREKGGMKVLAVTVLTSLDQSDLAAIGVTGSPSEQVLRLAKLAKASGLDGVVCSAHEIETLRRALGPDFMLIVPGIRPAGAALGEIEDVSNQIAQLVQNISAKG